MVWGGGDTVFGVSDIGHLSSAESFSQSGRLFQQFSLSSLLPPRGPHRVNFTALMHLSCTDAPSAACRGAVHKNLLSNQVARSRAEVNTGLTSLPQGQSSVAVAAGRWEEHRKRFLSGFSSPRGPASSCLASGEFGLLSPSRSVLWPVWKTTQELWSCFLVLDQVHRWRQGFPAGRREESWRSWLGWLI